MADDQLVTIGFLRGALATILVEHKKQLSARIAALESRRLMSFEGAHDPARIYKAGSVVQRSGNLFVAMVETGEAPGSSQLWRMIGVCK